MGGEFRTPKVMNQTSPESHRRMHQMSAYQRKVMSNAVGAWQSVGTTLSDTPLDEHAVRAAWERREWARQAEEAAAAAARREEDERAARLERGPAACAGTGSVNGSRRTARDAPSLENANRPPCLNLRLPESFWTPPGSVRGTTRRTSGPGMRATSSTT